MIISMLVMFHIFAGAISLLFGVFAITFKKGSDRHRKSGTIFFAAMLLMSLTAAYVAFSRSIMLSFANAFLVIYLVSTGWMTVKRKAGEIGFFEKGAFGVALIIMGLETTFGIQAANSATGLKDGFPPQVFFFFASVAAIAAILDVRMLYRGGLYGVQRLTRHLWRMCFPFFMATAAFFLGQAKVFPEPFRKIEILALPVIVVVLLMVFWLFRVRFLKRYKRI